MSFEDVVDKVSEGKILSAMESPAAAIEYVKKQKSSLSEIEYYNLLGELRNTFSDAPEITSFITEEIRKVLGM